MSAGPCAVPGCERGRYQAGYCGMHYLRLRRTGTTGSPEPQRVHGRQGCVVPDCPNVHKARGYCIKHYANFMNWGDPLSVGNAKGDASPNWVANPSYGAVHTRLQRLRGRAKDQRCVCGEPAYDWCYNHADPNEVWQLVAGYLIPYSTDPAAYDPLCRCCHRQRDLAHHDAQSPARSA